MVRERHMSGKEQTSKEIAMRASKVSIFINIALSLFKLFAGLVAHSGAMLSDAVHSASDVLSTVIVMIGVYMANRKSDEDHPYGHERMECVASIILSALLFATGLAIGKQGIEAIFSGDYAGLQIPGALALVAAVLSIVVKEGMFWYTKRAAEKANSGALMADAWHHRSDALSSIGAFIGIFGARMGYPVMDSIASTIICLFIIKAAYDIFKDAVDKMVDKACDEETVQEMRKVIEKQEGVVRIDSILTRMFGARAYIDIEIAVDGDLRLRESHSIAERVHNAMEQQFPQIKHCMVHVNPDTPEANGESSSDPEY